MTSLPTTLTAVIAAAVIALSGGGSDLAPERVALVVDAAGARDGRELVDPRLREADAEVRLPRTSREAHTNIRYFANLGYRVVVVGPRSRAAAKMTGVRAVTAENLSAALALLGSSGDRVS